MKKEYDFSKAEQGKFYRPTADLEIPIYLNKEVKTYFIKRASDKNLDLDKVINTILEKDRRRTMLTAKKLMVPSSEEVRSEAVQTLIKRMGITKAAIFIRENMAQKMDYLKVKDELFAGKSAAKLYEEIKK